MGLRCRGSTTDLHNAQDHAHLRRAMLVKELLRELVEHLRLRHNPRTPTHVTSLPRLVRSQFQRLPLPTCTLALAMSALTDLRVGSGVSSATPYSIDSGLVKSGGASWVGAAPCDAVVAGASLGEYSSDATHGMQRLSCFEAAKHGDEGVNPLGRAYVDRGATGGRSCVRSKCSMNSFLCCSVVKYRNCLLRP